MLPALVSVPMMFHIRLKMDVASGGATPQRAVTLQHLLLSHIYIKLSRSQGMEGGRDKGNYHIFSKIVNGIHEVGVNSHYI
jgi:hypothetical protein